ncbi:dehydratase [Bacillus sp. FJAT-27916]|uniref:MaoC/PaaZ C-terminal domain-containing protein n=1 Tax=Bacillaceae TaxID=186817 RepID=UPI00067170F5|nr:MaoC/PaaZ C-terminal domain-containing protein [Bacillus sp. FJAT-27916]KMY44916.1 dehydratase [Bacillus sp. FJAT-27916]
MNMMERLQAGEGIEPIQLSPVTPEILIEYAEASGDHNPIHLDEKEAKQLGLPGIIAHGMWTMGNLAKLFTPYYEEGFLQDYQIRFRGMVFLGDIITLQAELMSKNDRLLTFQVSAVNQHGIDVLKGKAVFKLFH